MRDKNTKKTKTRRTMNVVQECFFCKEKSTPDFLKEEMLTKFTSERGKILARSRTGLCSSHQRKLTEEVKRARYLALLPFVVKPE